MDDNGVVVDEICSEDSAVELAGASEELTGAGVSDVEATSE